MPLRSWVLFVEDCRRIGRGVRQALVPFSCCFDLVTVENGLSASNTLTNLERHPPVLVILSTSAIEDGDVQALEVLRAKCREVNLPLVLAGARDSCEMATVAMRMRDGEVVVKTSNEQRFVDCLEMRLGQWLICH